MYINKRCQSFESVKTDTIIDALFVCVCINLTRISRNALVIRIVEEDPSRNQFMKIID